MSNKGKSEPFDVSKAIVLFRQVVNLEAALKALPPSQTEKFYDQTTTAYWGLRQNVLDLLCQHEELCELVSIAPHDSNATEPVIQGPALFTGLAILKGALESVVLSQGTEHEQRIVGFTPPTGE